MSLSFTHFQLRKFAHMAHWVPRFELKWFFESIFPKPEPTTQADNCWPVGSISSECRMSGYLGFFVA